jgi:phosphatidylserine/phosphatidylglycerophosphate/cardiolipin synthase-like enzyme
MDQKSRGRDLFIVDNSVSGWTGLRYLEEWTSIAKDFDIATGHFEIGALLALDGKWQQLEKIRILMGAETTHRTRKAILDAVRKRALEALDNSVEAQKDANPFLNGVPAILEALRSGQIECRVYDRDKFHAKAYITHAKLEVVGSQALVGSSNFSAPGLTKNIELNVQIQSAREVAQLQEWFDAHWKEATEVTEVIVETISRHETALSSLSWPNASSLQPATRLMRLLRPLPRSRGRDREGACNKTRAGPAPSPTLPRQGHPATLASRGPRCGRGSAPRSGRRLFLTTSQLRH